MGRLPDLPWDDLRDFILEVGSAEGCGQLQKEFCERIDRLVPVDHASCWFKVPQGDGRGGFPAHLARVLSRRICIAASPGFEQGIRDFNDHYNEVIPPAERPLPSVSSVDCRRMWRNTEFYEDYLRPLGIGYAMATFDDGRFSLSLHRSRSGPEFSERDRWLFGLAARHLVNLCVLKRLREDRITGDASDGASFDWSRLTRREADILRLLRRRLTAGEAGLVLNISRRTVEKHIADMYEKLEVYDRHSLLKAVYGGAEHPRRTASDRHRRMDTSEASHR